MAFSIEFDPQAQADLKRLRAFDRSAIVDTIERVLSAAPEQLSHSRIKRLRGVDSPQYRLRVGDFRVFYDVTERIVYVFRILSKLDATAFLKDLTDEA